jgi:hypothetical protein
MATETMGNVASLTPFEVGQQWCYRAPAGFERSRLVIGAILRFAEGRDVACIAVTASPQRRADGHIVAATIPLIPLTTQALSRSVTTLDSRGAEPPATFFAAFEAWQEDARGASYFTVPFEGFLDRMIALQMATTAEGGG